MQMAMIKTFKTKHMKNSKGETLPQPYLALAKMRREQYKVFSNEKLMVSAFNWVDTLEGGEFWAKVSNGLTPDIPAASLAELEDWRKYKPAIPKNETAEPDWKAMYEDMKAERDYYRHEYELKSMELDDIDSRPTPDRNWVAECAMGFVVNNFYSDYKTAWDVAEKFAAEGRKRGHLPKNENA